jgi:tetratricopeptide (TPR) repeat protein
MVRSRILMGILILAVAAVPARAQMGKRVTIPAGSDADHQLAAIAAATDAAQKLELINQFAASEGQGDMAIVADEQYVNYYVAAKNYDKAFEYGEKLFALDADNFANAVSMVRAAQEKGDTGKLFVYGAKAAGIVDRYKAATVPEGSNAALWAQQRDAALANAKDSVGYVEQVLFNGAYSTTDAAKKADYFVLFTRIFPNSVYSGQALVVAAGAYEQAQNTPKMLEVANGALAKDPNNVGMLLLLADYYSEKGEQLDKAEAYAKKIGPLQDAANKPEGVTAEQWAQQSSLQKGLALSALGQINIQKKDNAHAVDNFRAAAPMLKSNAGSYARNQYRLGFALLNLKRNAEAKVAFTEAASVDSPYRPLAQDKLKVLEGPRAGAGKKP